MATGTSSRQTAASSPPRTEASIENQPVANKNGFPGVVSVIDTLAVEGEVSAFLSPFRQINQLSTRMASLEWYLSLIH